MIPGTFIIVDNEPTPKLVKETASEPARPEYEAIKVYQQLLQRFQQL